MSFRVFAPATIGNVASGFDVLGLAVDGLGDSFEISPAAAYHIEVAGRDAEAVPLEPERNTVTIAAEAYYRLAGIKSHPFKVKLQRSLPLAGGLGSSAASSVAGAMAAGELAQAGERPDIILRAALEAESYVAGPHLDNIAPCYFGGLTLVQDTETLKIYPIKLGLELHLVLATPPIKIQTKDARRVLPTQLSTAAWTRQMAHCTTLALALASGDHKQLRFGLTDPFAEVARSPLIPKFNEAKARALELGAYGFSISGSGPTCFALTADRSQAVQVGAVLLEVFGPETSLHIAKPRSRGAEILR